jgi:hypothetical protein
MQKSRYAKNPLRLLPVLPAPIARAGPELPEVEIARRVIAEHALRPEDADRLYHALHAALRSAIAYGGAHTGEVIAARRPGGICTRCGAPMRHGTIGGRSGTWGGEPKHHRRSRKPGNLR